MAIVLNGAPIFTASNAIGAFSSPVFYGGPEKFAQEFAHAVIEIAAALRAVRRLGRDVVKNALVQMVRFAALSTKHPGFAEELEWRVVASPALYDTPRLTKSAEVVQGVPHRVVKVALRDSPDHNLLGLELPELIDRIIVGPCDFHWVMGQALCEELSAAGVPDPASKVIISDIPLRNDSYGPR